MAPRKPVKPTQKTEKKQDIKTSARSESKVSSAGTSSENNVGFVKGLKLFFTDERTRFVAGIFVLFGVLYLSLALISYFFTGAADQSKMDLSIADAVENRSDIQNWTSVTGAFMAETLIHRWFGISSFALLFFGYIAALKLLKVKTMSITAAFFHTAFWLIWLSITLALAVNPFVKEWLFFAPGGLHGEVISDIITSYIGLPGTILSLAGVFVLYSVITSAATIPFLKRLFSKKKKEVATENESTEEITNDLMNESTTEQNVAVGTEIIPEDWITKAPEEESIVIAPDDLMVDEDEIIETPEILPIDNDDVPFEIEPTKAPEELIVEPRNESDENDDPFYNVSKLGKYDPTLDLTHYKTPTVDLLKMYGSENDTHIDMVEQNANKTRIITTLQNYGIEIETIKATVGPTITLYEIVPKAGVRISKIRNLEYDIMLSLAATGIRIIAPIPGKGTIGIEVPNSDPQVVSMHSVIASKKFQESKFELPVAFGRTITNDIFMVDLTKMPHLLVAGATGQGKSVGLNAIITSLLYKKHPSQLKFVLVDPKKVEFNIYGDIEKHFLAKLPDGDDAIITDTSKVVETLNSMCKEMDDRYDLLKKAHVRNIKEYNEKFTNRHLNPEKGHRFLPYIVVIVDEFGDLIMTAGKEVEMPIARIAQLARAVGIHMIIATQRPSVNIITGVIKANFPARVAFRVSSMIDSRTILDAPGANQLVGRGDMLFSQGSDLTRVQCAFVDTPEVENIVHFIGDQQGYPTAFYLPEYINPDAENIDLSSVDMTKRDPLFEEAARLIVANQQGSTSLIQRKFSIGYNRAGRIVDQLEVAGIIGPFEGSKARQVLVMDDYHLEQILRQL